MFTQNTDGGPRVIKGFRATAARQSDHYRWSALVCRYGVEEGADEGDDSRAIDGTESGEL